jgi:dephospho-CoA kinase
MTTLSKVKIIGVGGRDRSGKDTVADLLIEHGYFGFSFGDYTREQTRKRHQDDPNPISVANMTETANWFRAEFGPDVILKAALKAFEAAQAQGQSYEGLVLYSVRAPIEADFILDKGGQLVWVEASDETRLQRRLANIRPGEARVTMEDMLAQEAQQADPQPGIPEAVQMNLNYVKAHATLTIENDSNDLDTFKDNVKKVLSL